MKIACVILGTRGDVQPMVALADGLNRKGHEVTICAPPENEELAGRTRCRFIAFGPALKKAIKENPKKQKGGVAIKISPKDGKKLFGDQINLLPGLLKGMDLILGAGIVLGVHTAADILNIPYRFVAYYPIILGTVKEDPLKNRMMFRIGRSGINLFIKGFINSLRNKFNLSPIDDVWAHWMGEEVIVACDRELNEARRGVSFPFIQTGFLLLSSENSLSPEVISFCDSGKPPVYIGFGSNPITGAENYADLFENVRDQTDQRLIISKGWADFPVRDSHDILYIDDTPFNLLFPRMAAVVYHGGTGTMAAVSRAGVPQAAFPFMGDQFDNRSKLVTLGVGPQTCDFKKLSPEALSTAIKECVTNVTFKQNALDLAKKLENSDGLNKTIEIIESIGKNPK